MSRLASAIIRIESRPLPFARRLSRQIRGTGAAATWGSAALLGAAVALVWLVS